VSVTVTANTRVYGLHVILEELRDSVWVVIASHEPPMYRALIQQMGGDGNTFTASNFYTYEQSVTLSASGAWTGGARAFRVRCRASARLRRSTATTPRPTRTTSSRRLAASPSASDNPQREPKHRMSTTPGYVSNAELASRLSTLVDRWNRRENQMIALLTQEEGTVVVTDGLGNNHTLLSFRSSRRTWPG
jgi:hypothetical protein